MTQGERGLLQDFQERLHTTAAEIDSSPDVTRRSILIGLGAVSAVTAVQGLGAARYLSRDRKGEVISLGQGDICTEFDTACWLPEVEPPQLEMLSESTPPITLTNTPPDIVEVAPPTETIPPVPPPSPPAVQLPAQTVVPETIPEPVSAPLFVQSQEATRTAEYRYMSYEEYAANAPLFIQNLPSLQTLHELWPSTKFFAEPERQLAHIAMLDQEIKLDPDEYRAYDYDYSRSTAFENRPTNTPRMSIAHWTGRHYDSPDHMANSMKSSNVSVQLYRHADNVTYQFVDQLNRTTGHTLGANDWAVGLEIYSGDYDGVNTPLYSMDPIGTKQSAYALLRAHHTIGMPVDMTTMLTHMAADLIFINAYYDPYSGQFNDIEGYKPRGVRKFDLPQEFMSMLTKKIISLDQALAA